MLQWAADLFMDADLMSAGYLQVAAFCESAADETNFQTSTSDSILQEDRPIGDLMDDFLFL